MKIQDYKAGQLIIWKTLMVDYIFYVENVVGEIYTCYWLNYESDDKAIVNYPDTDDVILSGIFCEEFE